MFCSEIALQNLKENRSSHPQLATTWKRQTVPFPKNMEFLRTHVKAKRAKHQECRTSQEKNNVDGTEPVDWIPSLQLDDLSLDDPAMGSAEASRPHGNPLPIAPPPQAPSSPLPIQDTSTKPAPSPSPLGEPQAPAGKMDEQYKSDMTILIASIHKCSGDWHRKSRELKLTVTRCENHELTKGSAPLSQLKKFLKSADTIEGRLDEVERKFALEVYVTPLEVQKTKDDTNSMGTLSKDCYKFKQR